VTRTSFRSVDTLQGHAASQPSDAEWEQLRASALARERNAQIANALAPLPAAATLVAARRAPLVQPARRAAPVCAPPTAQPHAAARVHPSKAPPVDPCGARAPSSWLPAIDPFGPATRWPATGAPAFAEPAAVQATPSFAPGEIAASWPTLTWDEEEPDFSRRATPAWPAMGLLGVALLAAGIAGMHMLSAESEREQRIAAAERTHQELVAADQKRLAEEAQRAAQEQARELAARAASAAAAEATAAVTAPSALRPIGHQSPSATTRKRPLARSRHTHARREPTSEAPGANDGQIHADDPIYGL
jgi:hypothetical protein